MVAFNVLSTLAMWEKEKGGSQSGGRERQTMSRAPGKELQKKKKKLIKAPSLRRLISYLLTPLPFSRPRTFVKKIKF